MFTIQTLKNSKCKQSISIEILIRATRLNNIFNPSLTFFQNKTYIAFRHVETLGLPIESSLLITDDNSNFSLLNLSKHCKVFNVFPVADPKLVVLLNDVWITFNTGYSSTENDIYLMRITPELGQPKRCFLKGRQKVEKNWGFFEKDNAIQVVYSISPPKLLKCEEILDSSIKFEFNNFMESASSPGCLKLTMGSQPFQMYDKWHLFVHQRFSIFGKRMYFGRLAHFDFESGNFIVNVKTNFFVHSFSSILGIRKKLNPNLLSCTYFSGLAKFQSSWIASYGINDFGFAVRNLDNTLR